MELSQEALKKQFHQEVIVLFKRMSKEIKHKPTRLMEYINKYGAYEAVVKYLKSESYVQDFAILWEKERLDLALESLIVQPLYGSLFEDELIKACQRKLKEYHYAPNKIEKEEPEEERMPWREIEQKSERQAEKIEEMSSVLQESYVLYTKKVAVTKEDWKQMLVKESVVTPKNLDLLLRIYLIGDKVTPKELSQEEGYLTTYPYGEVMTALAKRLRIQFKVDAPLSREGESLWWHLIFYGGYKDNQNFEWSLRPNLRQAIKELLEEEVISRACVEVKTQRACEQMKNEDGPIEVSESQTIEGKEENLLSPDLEHLFAQIYGEALQETEPNEPKGCKDISKIKEECLAYYGSVCEICGFDYGYTYGNAFENLIEFHHLRKEDDSITEDTDPTKDLIPICCNCHKVLHSKVPAYKVEEIQKRMKI